MKRTYMSPVVTMTDVKLANALLGISGPGTGGDSGSITIGGTGEGDPKVEAPEDVMVREKYGSFEGEDW